MTNHSFLPSSIPVPDFIATHLGLVLGLILLVFILCWLRRISPVRPKTMVEAIGGLTSETITRRFLAAIPRVTRELNLELATATQTEVFEATEHLTVFRGLLDLGTNIAQIHVPVTYRYHLPLVAPWKLELRGTTLIVHAPDICPSLPPAIHTDRMEKRTERGWARLPPDDLLAQLERQLTPTLSGYATDPRHLDLVRPQCRRAVAEFVQQCLTAEPWWQRGAVTALQIRFADEPAVSSASTLKLQMDL